MGEVEEIIDFHGEISWNVHVNVSSPFPRLADASFLFNLVLLIDGGHVNYVL